MNTDHKILVLNPPQEVESDHIDYPYFSSIAPALLVATLRQAGQFVHLLDSLSLVGSSVEELRDGRVRFGSPAVTLKSSLKAAAFDVALVYFSPFALEGRFSHSLAWPVTFLRTLRPDCVLLGFEGYVGGMHRGASTSELILRHYPQLDGFLAGESEDAILNWLEMEGPLKETFTPKQTMTSTSTLAAAVRGVFETIDVESYSGFLASVGATSKASQYGVGGGAWPVFFSRGCPFDCRFCTNPGNNYRAVPLEVCSHILKSARQFGVRRLFVLDDAANVRADFGELLQLAADLDVELEFPNGLRADSLNRNLVELLAEVTSSLTVSAESASARLQKDVLRKSISIEHVEAVASWSQEVGLPLWVHWMVGIPGETAGEAIETLVAARRLLDTHAARPLIQYATVLPGTSLGEELTDVTSMNVGQRMQHEPSFVPKGMTRNELVTSVGLLRQRTREARTSKVIINLTYRCNNRCEFCAVGNRIKRDLSLDYVKSVLTRYRDQGVSMLDLDGGEPTLHPHLLEIVAFAVEQGFEPISVTSNGRRLAYPDFAKRLLRSGIGNLLVSLHGPDAETHESITGVPGSFRETMAGIRNSVAFRPQGVAFGVNTTLSRQNFHRLDEMVHRLVQMGVPQLNVQFLTPFGRAESNLVPDPAEVARELRRCIERYQEQIQFQVINLPYCYLPGLESFVVQDLGKLSRKMVFVTEEEVNLYEYLATTRKRESDCELCPFQVACDGRYDFSEVLD